MLNERTNVNKLAGKEPWRYIPQFKISPEALRKHLIPEAFVKATEESQSVKWQWDADRYENFLEQRAQLLAQEVNAFLRKLEGS